MDFSIYKSEIEKNKIIWKEKIILRKIYTEFYEKIRKNLSLQDGKILEIGSGIGAIKNVINNCILTDVIYSPYIDFVQSAYQLAIRDESLSNIILFDVFHHLKYPQSALNEFYRALKEKGRVIIFEPDISCLGFLVYGLFHKEPVNWNEKILWDVEEKEVLLDKSYYSAQGNATRVFLKKEYELSSRLWKIILVERYSAISYVLSGGYSKPQLYPDFSYPLIKLLEKILDIFPALFSTRMLIVLEKNK